MAVVETADCEQWGKDKDYNLSWTCGFNQLICKGLKPPFLGYNLRPLSGQRCEAYQIPSSIQFNLYYQVSLFIHTTKNGRDIFCLFNDKDSEWVLKFIEKSRLSYRDEIVLLSTSSPDILNQLSSWTNRSHFYPLCFQFQIDDLGQFASTRVIFRNAIAPVKNWLCWMILLAYHSLTYARYIRFCILITRTIECKLNKLV